MDYEGSYSALIYEMMHKLEDVATVPALNGGYPSVALLEEWQVARKNLGFMFTMKLLNESELKEASRFLADTVDEYLTRAQDEFMNSIQDEFMEAGELP